MNIVSAARRGDLCSVQECVECGQDINATYKNERTALHWASVKKHVSMVRWLLERGADTEGWGGGFKLAVHSTHTVSQAELCKDCNTTHTTWCPDSCTGCSWMDSSVMCCMQWIPGCGDRVGTTWWAVDSRHWDVVSELLQNKADINLCDNHGNSPLHRASM